MIQITQRFNNLYGKLHLPEGRMDAIIIIAHGIGEHGGCYDEWAEKFVAGSIGVVTFDMRGHGLSPGIRGHAAINSLIADLAIIVGEVQKKFEDVPVVLFGHSMGGQIALSAANCSNIKVQGVIASSPLLKLENPPSMWMTVLAKCASYTAPWITIRTGVKASQLSQTGIVAKSTKTDPLLHKKISVKLFSDLLANGKAIISKKYLPCAPVLLMHGTADTLVSFKASQKFSKKNRKVILFKAWRDMRHDLLNDAGKEMVFRFVMKWIYVNVLKNGNVQNNSQMRRIVKKD